MNVSRIIHASAVFGLGLFLTSHLTAATSPMVVAYVPNWASFSSQKAQLQYDKLTHINIAFKNPDSSGNLSYTTFDKDLIAAAHAKGVKVFISLGGASTASNPLLSTYKTLLTNTNRANFVAKIKSYLVTYNVDGVDIDIEGPGIPGVVNYAPFISELSSALRPLGKGVSSALSVGYGAKDVSTQTLQTFDFINIMAYDATGSWSGPGQHSPMSQATSNIDYFFKRGVLKSKLVLGVPFYGRGWGSLNGYWSFKDIVAKFPGSENQDSVGSGSNIIYYNGIPTIKAKTQMTINQGLGGVMFWELSQDAVGTKSLLTTIYNTMHAGGPANPAPVVNAGADQAATLGSTNSASITLAGTVTDNDATTKSWTKVSGPGTVSFGTPGALTTSATFTVAGTYILSLGANDGTNATVTDTVQVVINPAGGGSGGTVVYQAEAASTIVVGAVKTSSFVDYINPSGDYIEWAVNAPTAGTYVLTFRYALSNGDRPLAISVNGSVVATRLSFPSTGSTSNYKTVSLTVTLPAGASKVRATAIGASGANMDSLSVSPAPTAPIGVG